MRAVPFVELETKRLILKPLLPEHAPRILKGLKGPKLFRFIPVDPFKTVGAVREHIEEKIRHNSRQSKPNWLNWVIILKPDTCVGPAQITVYYKRRSAFMAYYIFSPWWRRGIAKKACAKIVEHSLKNGIQ